MNKKMNKNEYSIIQFMITSYKKGCIFQAEKNHEIFDDGRFCITSSDKDVEDCYINVPKEKAYPKGKEGEWQGYNKFLIDRDYCCLSAIGSKDKEYDYLELTEDVVCFEIRGHCGFWRDSVCSGIEYDREQAGDDDIVSLLGEIYKDVKPILDDTENILRSKTNRLFDPDVRFIINVPTVWSWNVNGWYDDYSGGYESDPITEYLGILDTDFLEKAILKEYKPQERDNECLTLNI